MKKKHALMMLALMAGTAIASPSGTNELNDVKKIGDSDRRRGTDITNDITGTIGGGTGMANSTAGTKRQDLGNDYYTGNNSTMGLGDVTAGGTTIGGAGVLATT